MASLSHEEENYIRLSLLLTGITPRAVRSLFDREFAPVVLQETLRKEHCKLLTLYNRGILNKAQWKMLLSTKDSRNFDISLMVCLLTNIAQIPGYERLPLSTDISEGADLARIKHHRNYLAHLHDCRVDNSDFIAVYEDMTDVIRRLSDRGTLQECLYLRTKILDRSNLEIVNEIKRSQDEINSLKQTVQDHETGLQDVKGTLNAIIKTTTEDVVPHHLKGIITEKLESWEKDDKTFVTTIAAEHIMKCIQSNSFVIVTGNSGVGKTSAVRHAALQLQTQGYIIIPTSRPQDIVNVYNKVPNTVFIIDDLCGCYTLNQQYLDNLKQCIDDIKIVLKICKIIATCRLQVFKDERFKNLSVLNYTECNMNSENICLTHDEKCNVANAYFQKDKDKFVELYKEFDCFPLLCKLLSKKAIDLLFSNPFDYFEHEFDYFLNGGEESGKYKYCALCLIALFDNRLDAKCLQDDESAKQRVIEKVLVECKLNKGLSFKILLDALHTLEGSLVVKDKDVFRIIHDKMFDYVAYYFGKRMLDLFIEYSRSRFINERFDWKSLNSVLGNFMFKIILPDDMLTTYIKRMINDWEQGHILEVFSNRNMVNQQFKGKFLYYFNNLDKTIQLLLIGKTDHENVTPISVACFLGQLEMVNRLIECGAEINKCFGNGVSPVFAACAVGHLQILNILIEYKADINKCSNDNTSPVHVACKNDHLQILNRLIECGADINKCNKTGEPPVYAACANGHMEILNRLIECEIDINKCCKYGEPPIYAACENGHLDILNRLIECGADINKYKRYNDSSANNFLDITRIFSECHGDARNNYQQYGELPVYAACKHGHLEILNRLIECKADINNCSQYVESPVFAACKNGYLEIMNRLIECEADINIINKFGESPVDVAYEGGHLEIVNRLIACDADITKCKIYGKMQIVATCK